MYIFYPLYGLANRMRMIDSAYRFCRTHNKRFVIYWKRDTIDNCEFNKLFIPIDHLKETKSYNHILLFHKFERHYSLVRWLVKMLDRCHIIKFFGEQQHKELSEFTKKGGGKYLFVIVESYSAFFQNEQDIFLSDLFTLNDDMLLRINNEVKNFDNNIVGVHIRRTDNKDSIEHSPLELFVKRMQEEIHLNSNVRFYVASDDSNVKQYILDIYGAERILLPKGIIGRDSVEGLKQAVIEMYALSKTKYIMGSYYSSFSEISSLLGGINLKIIKNT